MPITLHTQPNGTLNLIGNPIAFEFSMTSVSVGDITRRFGYQLCDGNGDPISAIESASPKEGNKFVLDFSRDIRPFLYTEVPQCFTTIRQEPEMFMEVQLKYWELVYDQSTCKTTIENSTSTGLYPVINSVDQYWGYANGNGQGFSVLTLKPRNIFICRDQCDSIYLWSENGLQVSANYYVKGSDRPFYGTTNAGASGPFSYQINPPSSAIDIFNNAGSPPGDSIEEVLNNIHKIEIVIGGVVYFTYYLSCCCCHRTVWFQQSGGGYSSLGFDCDDSLNIQSTYTEVCTFQPKTSYVGPYSEGIRTKGGLSISNKESFKNVTLSKVLTRDELRDLRYYEDFLSSGSYYYEFQSFQGLLNETNNLVSPKQLVKFLPNAGSIRYYKKEECYKLVISGKINQPHQMPVYAI